jgi:mitofusin
MSAFGPPGSAKAGNKSASADGEDTTLTELASFDRTESLPMDEDFEDSFDEGSEMVVMLKRFSKAKLEIRRICMGVRDTLSTAVSFFQQPASWTEIRTDETVAHQDTFETQSAMASCALDRMTEAVNAVSRKYMKVAFVGGTSAGKSATINAMLGQRILPSGVGHTTNCFCNLTGSREAEPYIVSPDSKERRSVQDINMLADALSDSKLSADNSIQLHWPRQRCPLLENSVEIIDSPGMGMRTNFDKLIKDHCADADVFVLVANGESALSESDKMFFRGVNQRIRRPNVFVEYNRWDSIDEEGPDRADLVRKQHLQNASELLVTELNMLTADQIDSRVFFVSAKEAFLRRTNPDSRFPYPDNAMRRFKEFERFEKCFGECISASATRTRFLDFALSGKKTVADMQTSVAEACSTLQTREKLLTEQSLNHSGRLRLLQQKLPDLKAACLKLVDEASEVVAEKVLQALEDEAGKSLESGLASFRADFSPDKISDYQESLNKFVETTFGSKLQARCSHAAVAVFSEYQEKLYKRITGAVPSTASMRQSKKDSTYSVGFCLDSSALTYNFRPDIEFRFSFGISRLAPALAGPADLLKHYLSGATLPSVELPATTADGSRFSLGGLAAGVVSFLNSKLGIITVTVASLAFSNKWAVKPVLYGGGMMASLYAYEYISYTNATMERRYKKQLAEHYTRELKVLSRHSSRSEANAMRRELTVRLESLLKEAAVFEERLKADVSQSEADLASLRARLLLLNDMAVALDEHGQAVGRFLDEYIPNYTEADD